MKPRRFQDGEIAEFTDAATFMVGSGELVRVRRCQNCRFHFAAHEARIIALVEDLHRFWAHELPARKRVQAAGGRGQDAGKRRA